MKSLWTLILLIPNLSSASVLTDYFDRYQINQNVRCPIRVCAMDDYGHTYTRTCDDLRERVRGRMNPGQPVVLLEDDRGQGCYCPCDYGLERRARGD